MSLITTGTFPGPVGQLEYILNEPSPEAPRDARTAVICHPHPLYGGTMNTRIVFHAARALVERGLPVLRFNFRSVGRSAGAYDHGDGEQLDLLAAIAHVGTLYSCPIVLAGFSFGSTVVAKLLSQQSPPGIVQTVLLGLPVDRGDIPSSWKWSGPKFMISGGNDEFASVASLDAYFSSLAPPKQYRWIPGADHFLDGHMDEFRAVLAAMIGEWVSCVTPPAGD